MAPHLRPLACICARSPHPAHPLARSQVPASMQAGPELENLIFLKVSSLQNLLQIFTLVLASCLLKERHLSQDGLEINWKRSEAM
jgi:hypothetical protein